MTNPTDTAPDMVEVTQGDAIRFIETAFRNIELPPLSADDIADITDGLRHFRPFNSCTCMDIAGENPACALHGRGTLWGKENPDICELVERAQSETPLRAEVARLGAAWDVAGEVRLDASLADYNLVGRGRMPAAALTPLGLRVRDILSQDKSNG